MSIQNEIDRIKSAKTEIRDSIKRKGVDVSDIVGLGQYAGFIDRIKTGSIGSTESVVDATYAWMSRQHVRKSTSTTSVTVMASVSVPTSVSSKFQLITTFAKISTKLLQSSASYNHSYMFPTTVAYTQEPAMYKVVASTTINNAQRAGMAFAEGVFIMSAKSSAITMIDKGGYITMKMNHDGIVSNLHYIGPHRYMHCLDLTDYSLPTISGANLLPSYSTTFDTIMFPANTSVTLKSITFNNCTNLSSIINSKNVLNYDVSFFRNCSKLSEIRINNATVLSDAFKACTGLKYVELSGTTVVNNYAFNECADINLISIDGGNVTISPDAFINAITNVDKCDVFVDYDQEDYYKEMFAEMPNADKFEVSGLLIEESGSGSWG